MHIIPQLWELESRFAEELVVIGVHSAKYTTEKDDRHLAAAVQRNRIDHPVVNDSDMNIWQQYGVRAWPTLMFLDPEGRVLGKHEGEFTLDTMIPVVEQMIAEFDREGLLDRVPLTVLQPVAPPDTPLSFPVGVHATDSRLFIADTNHNRIIVATSDGQVEQVFGSGETGLEDGPADRATFNRPHGLTLHGEQLFIADTDNHALRRIDLVTRTVTTLAGTGRQAYRYVSGGPALETDLNSPWDVVVHDEVIYISMTGNHQLWTHTIGSDEVRRLAGTGHEGIRDGTLASSWLAQPSGAGLSDGHLVFADAETSSIRSADLDGDKITTFVGRGLFDWGDTDGPLDEAQLQHAVGVAVDRFTRQIYVADCYNNKIKRLDPIAGTLETLLGNGTSGSDDGSGIAARFFEPHALSVSGGFLYIADTNNHAIRRADLNTRQVVTVNILGP